MAAPWTARTTFLDVKREKDKTALIEAINEETVESPGGDSEGSPEGKTPEEGDNIQNHEDNENYESRNYAYFIGKGQGEIGKLNLSDIKKKKTLSGNTAFHIAARYGINPVVKKIAEYDIGLFSAVNSNQDRAYHVAARAGHISTLQILLAVYAQHLHNIGQREGLCRMMLTDSNKRGNTIFHEALMHGDQKGFAIFEALSSPVTILDREGAAKSFSLLESDVYGEEVAFSKNVEGKTPLYLAVKFGYKSIVERLLKNCEGKPKGKSPILAAIVKRDSDMLKIILRNKEEWIHIKDDEGLLPLHYAARVGHLVGVCLLLDKCHSCTLIKDKRKGSFPLHMASYGGHLEVFKKLLRYCPDPCEMLNDMDQNVLHIAAGCGNHKVVSYILQDPDFENMINEKDKDGNTPLHMAARFSHARAVHTLIRDKRVDTTVANNKEQTVVEVVTYVMSTGNIALREKLSWIALRSAIVLLQSPCRSRVNKTESFNIFSAESEKASLEGESSNNVPAPSKEGSLDEKSQDRGTSNDPSNQLIETLLLVATLIVTVTFAAGIQFPGGSNDVDGQAKLLHKGMFQLYIISITISMYGALIATVVLLLARLGDNTLLLLAIDSSLPLLGITLATLSLAFLSAVYLVISKLTWLVNIFLLLSISFGFTVLSVYMVCILHSYSTSLILRNLSYYPLPLLAWLYEEILKMRRI